MDSPNWLTSLIQKTATNTVKSALSERKSKLLLCCRITFWVDSGKMTEKYIINSVLQSTRVRKDRRLGNPLLIASSWIDIIQPHIAHCYDEQVHLPYPYLNMAPSINIGIPTWVTLLGPIFILLYFLALQFWTLRHLRDIPGPLATRLFDFWLLIVCRAGKRYKHVDEAHKRYGPIVHTAQPCQHCGCGGHSTHIRPWEWPA